MTRTTQTAHRIAFHAPFALFASFAATLLFAIPAASQTTDDQIGLRLIAVRTEAEATSLLNQIQSGKSFDEVAKARSTDSSAKDGGFLGTFRLTDLKPDLQRIVTSLKPGQISPPTAIGGEFLILQRLTPEEGNWLPSYNAGLAAFESTRYEEAAQKFLQALPYAEKLTPVDDRLEDNLHGLAEAYRLQKKYAEAEPIYRRYLTLHWGGPAVPDVLDRFSTLVALSYFQDAQFEQAYRNFRDFLEHSVVSEELFTAMSSILFDSYLINEAEAVAERATRVFPASRVVHYQLAELYRRSWKPRKALEEFEKIGGTDPFQRSVVYQKIGSIRAELTEFDEAAVAYRKALEFTPDSVEAHLGLGDVYLQQGRPEDALSEYNRGVAMDPKSVPAHFRVADANLRMGRFKEASEAAAKVLAIDGRHRRAHYVLATALVRLGANADSDRELEVYRKLEAEARAADDHGRNIVVANRDAGTKLLEGHADEAIEMLRKTIETFPDSASAYLNLATAQSKLGEHKAAVETFQQMVTRNLADGFLVPWHLSQEYRFLGDMEASLRYRVVYLQNIDLALRDALEPNLN
jgi:tetratricopeptide (TPR) repeat protein